jgi:hypothetical protein
VVHAEPVSGAEVAVVDSLETVPQSEALEVEFLIEMVGQADRLAEVTVMVREALAAAVAVS